MLSCSLLQCRLAPVNHVPRKGRERRPAVTREELLHELMKTAELSRGDAAKFYEGLVQVAVDCR